MSNTENKISKSNNLSEGFHRGKKWDQKVVDFVDHWSIVVLMNAVTVYSLFFDDIRIIGTQKETDEVFYALTVFSIFCFVVEIVLNSIARDEFWLGFFFWLDIISTITMIPDCGWIWDPITGGGSNSNSTVDIAKTARAARVTRIIRIIRIIRLVRIVKLY